MKRTIWQNIDLKNEDWKDFLEEYHPDIDDEYEQMDLIREMNSEYLWDERANLNKKIDGRILAIADLGRWNGRCSGYKILDNNISSILETDCDYCEWYSDGYNIKFKGIHHDSTNYYEYRVIRENRNIENLLNDIYEGNQVSRKKLNYYTKSLHPYIADIYGWR